MKNIELPARMSPCLRLFIESLLAEADAPPSMLFAPEAPIAMCATLMNIETACIESRHVDPAKY